MVTPADAAGAAAGFFHPGHDATGHPVVTLSLGRLTDNDRANMDPATGRPGPPLYVEFAAYMVTYHDMVLPQPHRLSLQAPPPTPSLGDWHIFVDATTGQYMEGMTTDPSPGT